MQKKRLSILGSTGSIGVNTLDIVRRFPDKFQVIALSCRNQVELLASQIREFHPRLVCVNTPEQIQWLASQSFDDSPDIVCGVDGLIRIATEHDVDLVVAAIVGAAGLQPGYAAVKAGKTIALANKETMVLAGELIMNTARDTGSTILPIDSEHNAIFQSIEGHQWDAVEKIILTASGGPFRDKRLEEFSDITLEEALNHPNWNMGAKITIDSATMMNKGLEVIEARWLFDLPVEQVEVVIHRQSIIHSLVQYIDGSFIAQLGLPDMRVPIAYCLAYPNRLPLEIPKMDLAALGQLDFAPVPAEKFPCLKLAFDAALIGAGGPAVLNGANEEVVAAYLKEQIHFTDISRILIAVMAQLRRIQNTAEAPSFTHTLKNIDDAINADQWGRHHAQLMLEEN